MFKLVIYSGFNSISMDFKTLEEATNHIKTSSQGCKFNYDYMIINNKKVIKEGKIFA